MFNTFLNKKTPSGPHMNRQFFFFLLWKKIETLTTKVTKNVIWHLRKLRVGVFVDYADTFGKTFKASHRF